MTGASQISSGIVRMALCNIVVIYADIYWRLTV